MPMPSYSTWSKRQHTLLRNFLGVHRMPIAEAQKIDQRPFRSLLIRKWIGYSPGRGFHITPEGRKAWDDFEHGTVERSNPTRPLTAYFDPIAYGLKDPYQEGRRHKLHVMEGRGAA